MKSIILKLHTHNILQRIHTHTYYTGEARKRAGLPMMMAAGIISSNEDNVQLNDHLAIASSEIAKMLGRFLAVCHSEEHVNPEQDEQRLLLFTLVPPANFPHECIGQLQQCIENYAVMRTLQLWLAQHKPDEAVSVSEEVHMLALQMREIMAMRKRPLHKKTIEKNRIDI